MSEEPYVLGYDRVEIPAPRPDMTELIEAVARGIRDSDAWRTWKSERAHTESAQAALTAITDAGYRIVKDEVVAWMLEWQNVNTGKPMRATTIGKPEAVIGEVLTPLYAALGGEK